MIDIYCHHVHRSPIMLCRECANLADYARHRLARCPYGDDKPTCAKCPIHCYKPATREQVKEVMRYAGPRMLLRKPILALRHMIDEHKPAPPPLRRKVESRG